MEGTRGANGSDSAVDAASGSGDASPVRPRPGSAVSRVVEPRGSDATPSASGVAGGRSVTRRDLESIILRAAELSNRASDADEQLTEDEVVRIAAEIGLEPVHVRQALYELPSLTPAPTWSERYFGGAIVTATRSVPGPAPRNARRLEEYLTTREYLQIVRRRDDQLLFEPAEDAISSIARGILRPGARHHLSRARRVLLSVQPLDETTAHVRVEADLSEQRRSHLRSGVAFGVIGGLLVGTAGAIAVDVALASSLVASAGQVAAFGGGLVATAAAAILRAGTAFRTRVAQTRTELDTLLDRAERGERLEPPPAPWRRRLQAKLRGGDAL